MGDLHPTDAGIAILPAAAAVSPALIELEKATRRAASSGSLPRDIQTLRRLIEHTTEYADVAAAADRAEALDLQLRGPNGAIIPTEWIDVRDTAFLMSLTADGPEPEERDDDDVRARSAFHDAIDFEELSAEPWEPPFPRYQLLVRLRDERSVP